MAPDGRDLALEDRATQLGLSEQALRLPVRLGDLAAVARNVLLL